MTKATDSQISERFCNATAIRKASRRVTQFYDAALEPSGLRSTQFAILSQLARPSSVPTTIGALAAELVLDRSALGHNLRPLLRDGYVALHEASADRRRTHVAVTPLGRTKYRQARKLWQHAQNRFESSIGKAKAARLREALREIAHSIDLDSLTL